MNFKTILWVVILGVYSLTSYSQQPLSFDYPGRSISGLTTPFVSLYVCESNPTNYKVDVENISPWKLANISFTFKLPPGIEYVPGSFIGPAGSSVSFFNLDSVHIRMDTLYPKQDISLFIDLTAGCDVYEFGTKGGGTFNVDFRSQCTRVVNPLVFDNSITFPPIIVNYPIIQMVEKSFVAPALPSLVGFPQPGGAAVGDRVDRQIKIKNGGTSRIDSIYFVSAYKTSIRVDSFPNISSPYPPPVAVLDNRTQYITLSGLEFSKIGNGDNYLDPGEEFIFYESITILNCINTVSIYTASWGCGSTMCQNESLEKRIVFNTSSPRLTAVPVNPVDTCYGVTPSGAQWTGLQLRNTAINPIDSAENVTVDVYQGNNGFVPNYYSVIDTSSIRVVRSGYGQIPFTIVGTSPSDSATCNAAGTNSVGRFKILIDKIYAGDYIRVLWRVHSCVSTTCTNGNMSVFDWGYNLTYENRCNYPYKITNGIGLSDKDMRHNITAGSTKTQVFGTPATKTSFEFNIENSYFGFPADAASDYLRYEITKPTCMVFDSLINGDVFIQRSDSTFLYPSSKTVSGSGNKIILIFKNSFYNLNQSRLVIKMTPNCTTCSPGTNDEIKVESFYKASSCSVGEFKLGCVTSPLSIQCTKGCNFFGLRTSSFYRNKNSYGLIDYNNDGIPDVNSNIHSLNRVNNKIASYGDVVNLKMRSEVYGTDKSLLFNKFIYFYAKIDNGDLLDFDSLKLSYNYAINKVVPPFFTFTTVSVVIDDTTAPFQLVKRPAGGDSVEYLFKLNIDTLKSRGYFPNFPIVNSPYTNLHNYGFSYIDLNAYYHVKTNPGLTTKLLGADFIIFPDTASLDSNYNINSRKINWCFLVKDNIQVIGFDYNSQWNTFNTFNSCDSIQVTERFRFNMGTWIYNNPATNYYKNEYRNFSYLDTLTVNTGSAYNIKSARLTYHRTNGTLSLATVPDVNILQVMSGSGNQYVFDLKQLFRNPFVPNPAKPFIFSDEGYMADLTLTFEPNCQNQGGTDIINYTWTAKTDSLKPKLIGCNTLPIATGRDRLEYIAPQPDIFPTVQYVRVKGKQVTWDVLVSNSSPSYAKNVWLGFKNISTTTLTVNSVTRLNSGSPNNMTNTDGPTDNFPFTYTPSGNIYRVKDLAGGKDIKFRITATIDSLNCGLDSLVFSLGYSCDGYPVSIDSVTCPTNDLTLYAEPMRPTLFNVITTTKDTIELCDTAQYTFIIENTNIGKAYNVKGVIYFQQYLNYIPGSAEVFDFGTSTWVPIIATLGYTGQYKFNISSALSITLSDGLAGFGDPNNKLHIRFNATAECNYTSGSRIEISSSAETACGSLFESLPTYGSAIHIQGATPNHRDTVIIDADFLSPCFDSSNVNIKIANFGPIDTWVGDSITVALPRGVRYARGTYSPVSNAAPLSPSSPSILFYGGREYLTWTLFNLVQNIDTAEFNFEVYSQTDSMSVCENNYFYAYTTSQDSIVCSATGIPCNVKIISGEAIKEVFVYPATLNLLNPIATSVPNPPSGERVAVSFEINNIGQAINDSIAGNPIFTTISIFRDNNNSGTYDFGDVFIINKSKNVFIPVGLSSYLDTVDLPAGEACNFIVMIDVDENSCICETSTLYFPLSTLIIDEPNDTVCVNEPQFVGYQDSINGYTYTWRAASANASLSYLNSSVAANPIFTAPSITSNIDSMQYYVEVDRLGCKGYDTISIFIIKTPTSNAGKDTTVCYDSTRLNGNAVISSPSVLGVIRTYWTIDSTFGNGFVGVNISNIYDTNALATGLRSGSYKFIWNVDNGICIPETDTVLVNVINPDFTAGNDTVLCDTSYFQLTSSDSSSGFNYSWTILSSSPIGASLSNSNIISPSINGLQDGIYTLELELTGPGCNFLDTVIIEVNDVATVNAGVDSSLCDVRTFNLWADTVSTRRFGLWTVDSTASNYTNISFVDDSLNTTSVSFTASGNYKLYWNSIHPVCGRITDSLLISIFDTLIPEAGRDTTLCISDTTGGYALTGGSVAMPAVGVWKQQRGTTVRFSDTNSSTATVRDLLVGEYRFDWVLSNGVCATILDSVIITVYAEPTSDAGLDETICVDSVGYRLDATSVTSPEVGVWRQVSGTVLTMTDSSVHNTSLSNLVPGVFTFEWSVSNGICDPITDTVEITIFDTVTANAGVNDTICIDTVGYGLTATAVILPSVGTWTQVSGVASTIVNPLSPTSTITVTAPGVYQYLWTVDNGVCSSVWDTVTITVFDTVTSDAGLDDTICVDSVGYRLDATAVTSPEVGVWRQVSGTVLTMTDSSVHNTSLSNLVPGVFTFEWSVSNGICDPITDTVEITIFDTVTANAGVNDTICIDTVGYGLTATAVILPSVGTWTQVSGVASTIVNPLSPTSTITVTAPGVYQYLWTVDNGVCSSVWDTVTITVFDTVTSDAGLNDTICVDSVGYRLDATSVTSSEVGVWRQVSGTVLTMTDSSVHNTSLSNLVPGVFTFEWSVSNGICDPITDTVEITIFDTVTANAGVNDTICIDTVGYGLTATAVILPSVGTWTQVSGVASTIVNPLSPTSTITVTAPGVYQYLWTVDNGVCSSVWDTVTITVFDTVTSDAGLNDTICVDSVGYRLDATAVTNPEIGVWRQISGTVLTMTDSSVHNTSLSNLVPGVFTFEWSVSNGICDPITDTVEITIFDTVTANAGANDTICIDTVGYGLTATAVILPSVGTWTQVSGVASTIVNPLSPTSTITVSTPGVYQYLWTVDNGVCSSVWDTVTITVFDTVTSDAGLDETICVDSVGYRLDATSVTSPEVGVWRQVSGTVLTMTDSSVHNTSLSNLVPGVFTFEWSVSNGICDPITDTVEITIFDTVTANAGVNDTICIDTVGYGLTATAVILPSVGTWTQVSGVASTIVNPLSPTSTITVTAPGVYQYLWTVDNGVCSSVWDTVTITVFDTVTSDAGLNDTICVDSVGYRLDATSVTSPEVGVWRQVSGTVLTMTDSSVHNTSLSNLVPGVFTFEWSVSNGICDPITDTVEITIFDTVTANAGVNDTICIDTVGYGLTATAVILPSVGTWTQVSGVASTIVNPLSPTSTITVTAPGVYQYLWTVDNGVCSSVWDTVTITVFDTVTSDAGLNDTICVDSVGYRLDATSVTSSEVGVWRQVSGTVLTMTDSSVHNTSLSNLVPGVFTFEWSVSNGICDPITDTVEITIFDTVTANAGVNDTICIDTVGYGLTATAVILPSVGTWTQVSGVASTIVNPLSPTSTITVTAPGVYQYLWTVDNGVCSSVWDTVTITVFDTVTSDAGLNDTICVDSVGYRLDATAVTNPEIGVWRQISGTVLTMTDSSVHNTSLSNLVPGVFTFEWSVSNGICDSVTDTVEITIFDTVTANAGANDTICIDTVGYGLTATAVILPSVGTWTQVSGVASTIVNPLSPTSTITVTAPGVYQYLWTVDNGVCSSVWDTVTITVFDTVIANAGPNIQECTSNPVTLQATGIRSNETGTWILDPSNPTIATFSNLNDTTPTVSNLTFGTYQFIWSVSNGICSVVTDTMMVEIDSLSKPFAGRDSSLCFTRALALNADPIAVTDTGTWTQFLGPTSTNITNINDPKSPVTGLALGDYTFIWTVSNSDCPSKSDTVVISIIEQSIAMAGKDQSHCDTLSVTPLSSGAIHLTPSHFYNWSFDAANSRFSNAPIIVSPNLPTTDLSNLSIGVYNFVLSVSNGVCDTVTDTVQVEILGKPIVDFNANDTAFCLGECTDFFNLTTLADSSGSSINTMTWSFGDGSFSTLNDPTHCYDKIGSYTIQLVVTTDMGCTDTAIKTAYIDINPLPLAGFTIDSDDITPGSQVVFNDQSKGAINFEYEFGDGYNSFDQDPIHNYTYEGLFTVQQIVINQFGCRDTAERTVVVNESTKAFIPSAFTPNDDGDNDEFMPVLSKVDTKKYSFKVFNRWGELLFETSDITEGWDGSHRGVKSPVGVYVWTITYKEELGYKVENKTGHVTLIR